MIIQKMSKQLTDSLLKDIDLEKENINKESFQRKIALVLIYIFTSISLSLFMFIGDLWIETLISFITVIVIRWVSGGHHFESPDTCFLITLFCIIIVPITYEYIPSYYLDYLLIYTLSIYLFFSPYENDKYYWVKKIFLVLLVLLAYLYSYFIFSIFALLTLDQIKYKRS